MKVIGLTGGIASGKSTVSKMLKELGAAVIDADKIARDIVKKGKPALEEIVKEFGLGILEVNGELNRKKLGSIVFSNQAELEKLNNITHPRIIKEIENEINWYKQYTKNSAIIVDAALLIELHLENLVDEVWMVYVPIDIQINRLINRDNISDEEANNRIGSQISNEEKLKLANVVIYNSGSIEELSNQVTDHWLKLKNMR